MEQKMPECGELMANCKLAMAFAESVAAGQVLSYRHIQVQYLRAHHF